MRAPTADGWTHWADLPERPSKPRGLSLLPDPRLPRSLRVRDRWARMRPPPPLERVTDLRALYAMTEAELPAVEARAMRWAEALESYYGPGEFTERRDPAAMTLTITYHPTNPRRT